jgi:hypothetical protein
MAERAGHGNGQGAAPRPDPGTPGGVTGFAAGGEWDACPPSATLAVALEDASGPGWRCAGASGDEMFGLLRQWQALESRAAAGKLGVLRALIREDDQPLPGGGYQGDLPKGWSKSLTHEVAAALSMPAVSADRLMWLAWDLEGRLPGVGGLLAGGALTFGKTKAVNEALQQLTSEDAATAEAMILPELPGKTYGQAVKLAVRAAITVDPESVTRRREDAERNLCRVTMFREESGAAALSGRDMPTDQALAAHASVCARAEEYKESGAFPDGTRMDQYRVAAYLDLLNGIACDVRIATGLLPGTCADSDGPGDGARDEPAAGAGNADTGDGTSEDDEGSPGDERPGDDPDGGVANGEGPCGPRRGEPGEGGPGTDGSQQQDGPGTSEGEGRPGEPPSPATAAAAPPRLADLAVPLATLLGRAERPGEGHGIGPLDPALCRELAAAAAGSADSRLCVTVTDPDGITMGHGCARGARRGRRADGADRGGADRYGADRDGAGGTDRGGTAERNRAGAKNTAVALPARLNLTISAARLTELARTNGPPGTGPWAFTPDDDQGPPGGYGTWTLGLPGDGQLTVELRPVPTFDCDHRYESHAYQPNETLRHLVQVRDGDCTFPPCSRHARESDFEHATPYDKGGRTCGCNAGARSRACHRVKQSPGWNVTQPRPGWHQWITPSGRTYIQGPKRYPV